MTWTLRRTGRNTYKLSCCKAGVYNDVVSMYVHVYMYGGEFMYCMYIR